MAGALGVDTVGSEGSLLNTAGADPGGGGSLGSGPPPPFGGPPNFIKRDKTHVRENATF